MRVQLLTDGKVMKRKKTQVRKATLSPVWNEPLNFIIGKKQLQASSLELIIMDHDLISADDQMGSVRKKGVKRVKS